MIRTTCEELLKEMSYFLILSLFGIEVYPFFCGESSKFQNMIKTKTTRRYRLTNLADKIPN